MTNSSIRAENTQDEPGAFVVPERKEVFKKGKTNPPQ